MYDYSSGVEVYIREHRPGEQENDGGYREYEVPRLSPHYTGDPRMRYIEAVTDQRFEIVVALHENFSFKGRSSVQAYHDLDGGSHVSVCFFEKSERPPRGVYKQVCYRTHAPVDGFWKAYGFLFGETHPSEDVQLSADEEAAEVKRRGVITVYLERGKTTKCRESEMDPFDYRESNVLPSETSQAVAIEHGKTHSLKTINVDEEMDMTRHPQMAWTCAQGKGSEQLRFTFFYSSGEFLEKEGIKPRAQSRNDGVHNSLLANADARVRSARTSSYDEGDNDDLLLPPHSEIEPGDYATSGSGMHDIKSEPRWSEGAADSNGTNSQEPSPPPRQRKRRRQTQPPIEVIDLCSDDEVPAIRIKEESTEEAESPYATSTFSSTGPTPNGVSRIKQELQSRRPTDTESNATASSSEGFTKPARKAKERTLINLQLEEVRLKRRLVELEGDDDDDE